MSRREIFLDDAVGERRGVVLVDGKAERLLVERASEPQAARLGARSTARVRRLERTLGTAFVELPEGLSAAAPAARLVEGQTVEVEVVAEARAEKACVVRVIGPADGVPRIITAAPAIEARLATWAPGETLVWGRAARDAADRAEEEALASAHMLPGGARLFIETTRALVAVDVDLGGRTGGDARRVARQTNLAAIAESARLLRLKSIGGLIVLDLVGKGHDGAAMTAAAKMAFAGDGEGVSIGPISRFGLFELAIPHAFRPLVEVLLDPDGRPSTQTMALRLARALEREGRAAPGARLFARCAADVADSFAAYDAELADRIGGRFQLEPAADTPREVIQVRAQ